MTEIKEQIEQLEKLNLKADPAVKLRLEELNLPDSCDVQSLRLNYNMLKADLTLNSLNGELGTLKETQFAENLLYFVETACEESGKTEINVKEKTEELLNDVKKLEKCVEKGFEQFLTLVLQ